MLRFDKETYLSPLFQFILSVRLSISLWGSDVSLFLVFINLVCFLIYDFIEFNILLYTFLVISFARYKEYITYLISFSKCIYYLLLHLKVLLVIFEAFV